LERVRRRRSAWASSTVLTLSELNMVATVKLVLS
jgi:hypothetical protein